MTEARRPSTNRCRCSHTRDAHDPETGRCHFCRCLKFDNKNEPLQHSKPSKPGWHEDAQEEE